MQIDPNEKARGSGAANESSRNASLPKSSQGARIFGACAVAEFSGCVAALWKAPLPVLVAPLHLCGFALDFWLK